MMGISAILLCILILLFLIALIYAFCAFKEKNYLKAALPFVIFGVVVLSMFFGLTWFIGCM
jgi:hypothetical protein